MVTLRDRMEADLKIGGYSSSSSGTANDTVNVVVPDTSVSDSLLNSRSPNLKVLSIVSDPEIRSRSAAF